MPIICKKEASDKSLAIGVTKKARIRQLVAGFIKIPRMLFAFDLANKA